MIPAKVIKNRLCDVPGNLFGAPNRNWLSDHVLQEMFTDPYPGMSGALCDLCSGQINIASGFFHCNICEKDMCKDCEWSFCNEQKCMKKITEDPYLDKFGVFCDLCKRNIRIEDGFFHCTESLQDLC